MPSHPLDLAKKPRTRKKRRKQIWRDVVVIRPRQVRTRRQADPLSRTI